MLQHHQAMVNSFRVRRGTEGAEQDMESVGEELGRRWLGLVELCNIAGEDLRSPTDCPLLLRRPPVASAVPENAVIAILAQLYLTDLLASAQL